MMPEAVIDALHKIGRSLEKQSGCMAVEAMDWLLITVLKKAVDEVALL